MHLRPTPNQAYDLRNTVMVTAHPAVSIVLRYRGREQGIQDIMLNNGVWPIATRQLIDFRYFQANGTLTDPYNINAILNMPATIDIPWGENPLTVPARVEITALNLPIFGPER